MLLAPVITVQAYSHSESGSEHNNPLTGKAGMITPKIPGNQVAERLPMGMTGVHFIENKGQITDQYGQLRGDIDFKLTTGKNINAFIGSGNIHYQWYSMNPETKQVHTYRLDLALVGANKNAEVLREEQQSYFEKYYKDGSADGAKARTWNRVIYKDIYPNIDWVLYLNGNVFEYDFVVHPGGRVSDIRLQYNGAQSLKLDKNGNLVALTPAGSITEKAPVSFEESGKEIASRFSLSGNRLSFKTGNYNRQEKFIIDPVVEWATYYGGIGDGNGGAEWDVGNSTAFDKDKNIYLAGYTNSANNIATTGSFQDVFGGGVSTSPPSFPQTIPSDAFLAKFDPEGKLLWATYYGGDKGESGNSVTCDELGNIYLAGSSGSTNIKLSTPGSHQEDIDGASDAFLVKFDGTGTRIWATYFGGDAGDEATFIVSDKGGHIYMGGNTYGSTNLAVGNAYQDTFAGGTKDAFLAKFKEDGSLEWATYYGGDADDDCYELAWDAKNQKIYLGGSTDMSTTLASPGAFQDTLNTYYDGFVAKFDVLGNREWATYYGGNSLDLGYSIACDDAGNVYFSGMTRSTELATPGAHQDTILGGTIQGNFLVKFFADGTRDWATYYGGSAAHVTTQGYSVYLGGQTADTIGIATPGTLHDTLIGLADVFMVKFDTSGVRQWGTYFGSNTNDNGGYLACDGSGNIYMTGRTYRPIGHPNGGLATPGAHQDTFANGGSAGSLDAFLVKFSDCVQDLAITVDSLTLGTTGSSKYKNYQWYKDGVAISGATDSIYIVSKNAMYSVSVVSALNGCPDSAFYEITNIIEDDDDDDDDDVSVATTDAAGAVKVYPNPAKNIVYIQAARPVDVQIKSIEGKLVIRQQSVTSVDISGISSGIYMLSITDAEGRLLHTEKLVKEGR